MRPPRRGEIWIAGVGPAPQAVLVISSTVYNEIASEPTVTFVAKSSLTECQRKVDVHTLTSANTMLFKILAAPER